MRRLTLRWPIARRQREPLREPTVVSMPFAQVMRELAEKNHDWSLKLSESGTVEMRAGPPTAAEMRERKELEAVNSVQPFEYASHVYVTVYGETRWKCCGNLFVESHSPWCASPGDLL